MLNNRVYRQEEPRNFNMKIIGADKMTNLWSFMETLYLYGDAFLGTWMIFLQNMWIKQFIAFHRNFIDLQWHIFENLNDFL